MSRVGQSVCISLLGLFGITQDVSPVRASDVMVGVHCMRMGYTVIDPIYMGRTASGYDQWACASGSGVNIKGPPFPVLICDDIGRCRFVGWTY